ncbi:MAG: hypothetical protein HC852_08945 [Acaryochloridaceae cyanobacterium RU_4_10]|nr:hypothetical protein [Acaryochloridaceae cyanobacterium RU_4_10]
MTAITLQDKHSVDWENYENLILSINESSGSFSLFIAICEDNLARDKIIEKYEFDLQPEIISYQLNLLERKPNLEEIIKKLLLEDIYLQRKTRAVFTVSGIEALDFIDRDLRETWQDTFFGYLQWTRENFKKFPYPLIIWGNESLVKKLANRAPDFWDWRKEVFRFSSAQVDSQLSSDSLTWELCGKFEVPEPNFPSNQTTSNTNYAEHINDVLYG